MHVTNTFSGSAKADSMELGALDRTLQRSSQCSARRVGADREDHGVGGLHRGQLFLRLSLDQSMKL